MIHYLLLLFKQWHHINIINHYSICFLSDVAIDSMSAVSNIAITLHRVSQINQSSELLAEFVCSTYYLTISLAL